MAILKQTCTWEDLCLEKPEMSIEEKAEATHIPLVEYQAICNLAQRLKEQEEEK